LDPHRLNATPMSNRHDFVFAAQHPTHEGFTHSISNFPADEKRPNSNDSTFFDLALG